MQEGPKTTEHAGKERREVSFRRWILTNTAIYLGVLLASVVISSLILEPSDIGLRGAAISLVFSYPYLLVWLVVPTVIIVWFLWAMGNVRALYFRLVAGFTLAIPAIFSDHLSMALWILATQLVYALIVRRPSIS